MSSKKEEEIKQPFPEVQDEKVKAPEKPLAKVIQEKP